MKPSRGSFLEQTQSRRLGVDVNEATRRPRGRRVRPGGQARPHPRGPLVAPLTYFFHLYILIYPENIREHHETLFPPPQPYAPVRSHLGAFSGAPPEVESITEGFYINTIASPMMCEQFTTDLRVHSYQLDGFFSLFGSQYKVLRDLLGDLFDVILFAVCLSRSNELWVYDQYYLRTIFDSSLNSFMCDLLSLQVSSNYQFGLAYQIDLTCNGRSAQHWVQSCGVISQ